MRDSPCHTPVVLAGMFGMKKTPLIKDMYGMLEKYFYNNDVDCDQNFLRDMIYPVLKDSCMIHDEIQKYESCCIPFPIKYDKDFHFVGEYVMEDDSRIDYYTRIQAEYVLSKLPDRISGNMDIKYCLVSCDDNALYYEFYPIVKEYWGKLGINTKLVLVSITIPKYLEAYKDDIILFTPVENVHPAFQAQCIRNLYPALLDTDGGIIISDMDIIPLDANYFYKNIEKCNKDNFIVYRNIMETQQYPMCYCLGTPKVWGEIFGIKSVEDIRKILLEWWVPDYKVSSSYSKGWATDQIQLYKYVNDWDKGRVVRLHDLQTGFKRLDRHDCVVDSSGYSDYHLPRPFWTYVDVIRLNLEPVLDRIHNYILGKNKCLSVITKYGEKCSSILDCGTGNEMHTTYCSLIGIIKNKAEDRAIIMNDIIMVDSEELSKFAKQYNIKLHFIHSKTKDLRMSHNIDMVIIDTIHTFGTLRKDLEKLSKFTNNYIIIPDTVLDEKEGQLVRTNMDPGEVTNMVEVPINELKVGVKPAITEFIERNGNWRIKEEITEGRGIVVLERDDNMVVSKKVGKIYIGVIASRSEYYDKIIEVYWVPFIKYINKHHSEKVSVMLLYGNSEPFPVVYNSIPNNVKRYEVEESVIPGILQKTVLYFTELSKIMKSTDLVFRTNISSFIVLDSLLKTCSNINPYWFYGGVNVFYTPFNCVFVSGAGFMLSKDNLDYLVNNLDKLAMDNFDDVAVGQLLAGNQYCLSSSLDRFDLTDDQNRKFTCEDMLVAINSGKFHIRIKNCKDRMDDIRLFDFGAKQLYRC
jgi:hypothetical protein